MRKAINIIAIAIILNLLLCLTIVIYFNENNNTDTNYINLIWADKWELNYNDTSMEDIFLFNYQTSNITIECDNTYDISMFIENYDSYKNITFEILNNETYTVPGTYIIRIAGKYEKNVVIKEATLIINEKPVIQYVYYPTPTIYSPPIVDAPTTNVPLPTTPKPSITTPTNNDEKEEPITTEPVVEPIPVITRTYNDTMAYQVFELVNSTRTEQSLSPLIFDETLANNAKVRVEEASRYFSHTRPDGTPWYTAITASYSVIGENLASGFINANDVINGWMNSQSHKDNILSASYTKIGIATYTYNGVTYWAQEFSN